ncbi:MAG: MFS transporter [Chloroflexi bacterium]|nr:MFS transporter [Chloroflexota bacterium]
MAAPRLIARPAVASAQQTRSQSALIRHIFFVLAALAVLMGSIDSTIVAVAVPQLTGAFNAPLSAVAWTLTAYQLVQVVMLPLAGKLSDSFGRKSVFLACVRLFTQGSLLCGLASSIWLLVAARALQALGGGGLVPSATGVVADHYKARRAQAIGLFSSVFPIGGIVGPNLGGFILEHWTWREMFFVNVPIGIVVLIGVGLLLEPTRKRKSHSFDLIGLGLYGGAIVLLLAAMTAAADNPDLWSNPLLWAAVGVSIVLMALFLWHIKNTDDPVMEFRLVARQPFLAANLYNLLFGAAAFGFFSFIPTYAVYRFGLSPLLSGTVLTPRAIAMIVSSILASLYVIKLGYRMPMLVGMGLVATTLVLLGTGWTAVQLGPLRLEGFWFLALVVCFSGVGMGLSNPSSSNAALDLAPDKAAVLTGIRSMFRLTGGALSISGVVLGLTFFDDKAQGLSVIFGVLSLSVLAALPLVFAIPDSARARRDRDRG